LGTNEMIVKVSKKPNHGLNGKTNHQVVMGAQEE